MRLHKKNIHWVLGIGIVFLYVSSRLFNLVRIPIFTDEAIYIRWTQIFIADKHQFFISLTDGKQPLFIWLGYPLLKIIHDPLFGMRLVSVVAGFCTLIGVYLLTNELFHSKKTAYVAALLYVIYPFSLVYDKLAIYDSLVATFAVWALYVEVLLIRRRIFTIALFAAGVFAGGMLTKSSGFFFLYLIPFSLLLFDFKKKNKNKDLLRWVLLVAFATLSAAACYSVLRFSPNYSKIALKNSTFVFPLNVWIHHPFSEVAFNSHALFWTLIHYSTIPLLIFVLAAFSGGKEYIKEKLLLAVWFVAPITALIFFGNHAQITPRYIVFMTMPLLILAAFTAVRVYEKIERKRLAVLLLCACIIPILYKDFYILTNVAKADLPVADFNQLIAGYASGGGVKETANFLREKSKLGPVYVAGEGVFGLMPDGLLDYLYDDKNVTAVSMWPVQQTPPQSLLDAAKIMPTYVVFYAPCTVCGIGGTAPSGWPLRQVFQIKKLEKATYYTLYEVLPD